MNTAAHTVYADGPIEHTVVFRLIHPSISSEEQRFLADAQNLLGAIPGVQDFAIKRQVSAKSAHAWQFSMWFADARAYAAYDAHPTHVSFVRERWTAEVAEFQEYDFVVP